MKVVWLCYLNLEPFADIIGIPKNSLEGQHPVTWITTLYKKFSTFKNVELTIISTSPLINKTARFELNRIKYIIIPKNHYPFPLTAELRKNYSPYLVWMIRAVLFLPKKIFKFLQIIDIYSGYRFFILRVAKIIRKLNPDIIHGHGTEFAFTIPLNSLNFPTIVQTQGLMHNVVKQNNSLLPRLQNRLEKQVFKKQKNFIVNVDYIKDIIKSYNPDANFWKIDYMLDLEIFQSIPLLPLDSDLVFAAAIDKGKGIEDLILACVKVKNKFPDFKLKVMGYNTSNYVNYLLQIVNENNLTNNIKFLGFIPDRTEMLIEVKRTKISVLPTYHDTKPGTISEAMFLGVAVVAYNVGGIPDMIIPNESGMLVEKGNIQQLAESIIELLENEEKRLYLVKNAKERANRIFNYNVAEEIITAYSQCIENFHSKSKSHDQVE